MTYDNAVGQFLGATSRLVPIGDIRTSEALQPRVAKLVPFRDRGRTQDSSDQHIATLRLVLEASEQQQLAPVWIADIGSTEPIDTGLYLVDGHHRLRAYKQAGRRELLASVVTLDWWTAVVVSKLVNCTGRSLPMHKEQCRDAAWQYIIGLTQRGTTGLPKGESLRTIAGQFGISKNTVNSMLDYLKEGIDIAEFNAMAIDPGTGWPRWKYVRQGGQGWQTLLPSSPQEQLDREAEKVAQQIIKIVDKFSFAVRERALQMLASEEIPVPN